MFLNAKKCQIGQESLAICAKQGDKKTCYFFNWEVLFKNEHQFQSLLRKKQKMEDIEMCKSGDQACWLFCLFLATFIIYDPDFRRTFFDCSFRKNVSSQILWIETFDGESEN